MTPWEGIIWFERILSLACGLAFIAAAAGLCRRVGM
jgi:hypothetical protein